MYASPILPSGSSSLAHEIKLAGDSLAQFNVNKDLLQKQRDGDSNPTANAVDGAIHPGVVGSDHRHEGAGVEAHVQTPEGHDLERPWSRGTDCVGSSTAHLDSLPTLKQATVLLEELKIHCPELHMDGNSLPLP